MDDSRSPPELEEAPSASPDDTRDAVSKSRARRIDYKGVDLRRADFRNANLVGANFAGADLAAADFRGSNLTGANFAGANVSKPAEPLPCDQGFFPCAQFSRATLSGANFIGADVIAAEFCESDLTGANFTEANLIRVNFTDANLTRANFTRATLKWANLTGANLESARLRGSRVREAVLSNANLQVADLGGANLTGSNLSCANLRGADLSGAVLRGCSLSSSNLRDANLRHTDARYVAFDRAWLAGADLGFADLRGATFVGSWLLGTDLRGTKTSRSNFIGARCSATTGFPLHLRSLRWARGTVFILRRAGAWARLRGTEYQPYESTSPYTSLVVLRCLGERTSWSLDYGLTLLPFSQLIKTWTELLGQMEVICDPCRIFALDGFEGWQRGHSAVIAIGVGAATMPILAAILKASIPAPLTNGELLERAEKARAAVILMLQRLDGFTTTDEAHLSVTTTSDFYAGCIRAICELLDRGGDVLLIDSLSDRLQGPDAAMKIVRELREST